MSRLDDLYTLIGLLEEFELPVSSILEYAIKEKIEELSDAENLVVDSKGTESEGGLKRQEPANPSKTKTIRIIREDGSFIEGKNAVHTLVKAIEEIGAKRVYELKLPLDGMYLVTKGGNPQYPSAQYDIGDGFYVNGHSNTKTKIRQLQKIIASLNMPWKVEAIGQ